jgi:transposase-like protein
MISRAHGTFNKLTDAERAKIVRLYIVNQVTQKVLAKRFGVSERTIFLILRAAGAKLPNRSLTI